MKRFRILIPLFALLMVTPTLLRAQIVKGELILGGNITQVDGDECYRFRKPGVHVGAGALIPLTSYLDVGLEVLFNQKVPTKATPSTSTSVSTPEPTS